MTRLPVSGLEVFLAIVREGSLRAAAASLGLGPPAVSHQLKRFEAEIGAALIRRTTRALELTEAGRALAERAAPAWAETAAALEDARAVGQSETGALRLSIPWSAYRIIVAPALAAFQEAHPGIRLEFSFEEELIDVVRQSFHAGFRLGDRLAPGMVATRLTPPLIGAHAAAPAYLDAYGRPEHPRDLLAHRCIRWRFITENRLAEMRFQEDGRPLAVDPPPALIFDGIQPVLQAAREGHGIGFALRATVTEDLVAGRLETVLDAYAAEYPPFHIYYPEQNRRYAPLRLFVDFLAARRRG